MLKNKSPDALEQKKGEESEAGRLKRRSFTGQRETLKALEATQGEINPVKKKKRERVFVLKKKERAKREGSTDQF